MESTLETRTRAQDALDYLEENPEKHDQSSWFNEHIPGTTLLFGGREIINMCQTTMCAAGTVQFLERGYVDVNGQYGYPVDIDAASLLGLNDDEAWFLFHQSDESQAVDALNAVAQGDEDKFWDVFGNPAIT